MMMPLVRTKLQPPEALPFLLTRPRLHDRLRLALHRRLVLIAAPAGYGKTSLLAEWLVEARKEWSHIAWVSLDSTDNDIRRMLAYLLEALHHLPEEQRERLQSFINKDSEIDTEQWCAELLNNLAETASPTIIVLDDYHLISDSHIHQAITFLVDHLPPHCRLIILSRRDPPIPLARWRARGHLAELRSFDLAFSPEETATFLLETMDLPLNREQIVTLLESTEGWPAGLHLAALALRDRINRGEVIDDPIPSNRYVADYLIEDVFNQLPPHLQQFLLQTSILERLCGALCDAVLGVSDYTTGGQSAQSYSQSLLTELERNNLFLFPLDTERVWYRYHRLFADVLRERLVVGCSPEQVATLHRRAGVWYAAHGMLVQAVHHALQAQAIDDIVAMLEPNGLSIISQVSEETLRRWLPAIPEEAFEQHPRIALLRAWLATTNYQAEEASHWIAVAERALADVASGTATPIGLIANLRGELSAVRLRLAILQGNIAQALSEGKQALNWLQSDYQSLRMRVAKDLGCVYLAQGHLSQAEQAFKEAMINGLNAGLPYISALASSDYAYTLMLRGAFSTAIHACRDTLEQTMRCYRHQTVPGIGLALLGLTELYHIRHEFAGALPALAEAESLIKSGQITSYLCLLIVMARVARSRGDLTGALRVIRQTRFLAQQRQVHWVLAVLDGLEGQILLEQGDITAARQLLTKSVSIAQEFYYLPTAIFYAREHITRAQYEWRLAQGAANGDVQALRELAAELREPSGTALWQTLLPFDAALLRGLALSAAGEDATESITSALELAASERIVAPFTQAGEPLRRILSQLANLQQLSSFGEYIFSLFENDNLSSMVIPPSPTSNNLSEPLSQREIEVLRLMAEGRSNHEIAASLIIAVSTVKSHINNIFGKLGVASRTQAVARGRRLGLIP